MSDMGYVVSTSSAESWGQLVVGPPSLSLGRGAWLDPSATAIREVLLTPEWQMDAAGRVRPWSSTPGRGPARPR
jgi:hypothetical protein